jgi:hypothetical protein
MMRAISNKKVHKRRVIGENPTDRKGKRNKKIACYSY